MQAVEMLRPPVAVASSAPRWTGRKARGSRLARASIAFEALLLKWYDSAQDGRARVVPHTAFTDPTVPADVLPRESIELRTLVFGSG
jgi:hypothetical protein